MNEFLNPSLPLFILMPFHRVCYVCLSVSPLVGDTWLFSHNIVFHGRTVINFQMVAVLNTSVHIEEIRRNHVHDAIQNVKIVLKQVSQNESEKIITKRFHTEKRVLICFRFDSQNRHRRSDFYPHLCTKCHSNFDVSIKLSTECEPFAHQSI